MADVLASGPDRAPRRLPWRLLTVLGLLVVLAVGADRVQHRREVDALLTRAGSGQEAVRYADGRVRATLIYAGPSLGRADVAPSVRSSLERVVSGEATGQLAAVRARRDAVARTAVLPWHRDLRAARAAYVGYLDVRLGYLAAVGADLDALYAPHPELVQALARARTAFGRAAGERGTAALVLPDR